MTAYDSQDMRDSLDKRGLADGILWKVKHKRYPLEAWQKYANLWAGRIRSAVERAPATMKRWYGMSRVRYLGLARNYTRDLTAREDPRPDQRRSPRKR